MNHRTVGRIISAVIFSFIVALYMHHDHVNRGQMGREEFLTWESQRFDLYFAQPKSLAFDSVTCVILIGGFFVAYEAAAYGIARILQIVARDEGEKPPVS